MNPDIRWWTWGRLRVEHIRRGRGYARRWGVLWTPTTRALYLGLCSLTYERLG